MRIGIDAHILGKGKGGVETALLGIITALMAIDRENQYWLYVSSNHPFQGDSLPSNFHLRLLPISNPLLERPFVIPLYYRMDRLDVIHLQRIMPPWGCGRCVLHVHDLLYETHPQFFSPIKRHLFNLISRASVARASHIVTVTASASRDIERVYGVSPERITVISNGIDQSLFYQRANQQETLAAARRFNISGPYVLVLGMLERHKNTDVAIRAFERFAGVHPEYFLVIVGQARSEAKKGYPDELISLTSTLKCRDRVLFSGYASNAERLTLLNSASMLVFPSAAEGFGLPPLEAMACGIPVIAAETNVAREVYGDAALMTPALDEERLAIAMLRLSSDAVLRADLIKRGLLRARMFTWGTVASRLLDVYATVASATLRFTDTHVRPGL